MKKLVFSGFLFLSVFGFLNTSAFAQKETATGVDVEKDISLLRRDLRAEKKQLIALNLSLTENEATKFWPVYDQYVAEMAKHNDQFYGLIKDYAANQKMLTDVQASSMINHWADIQIQTAQTRKKFIPIVEKVSLAEKLPCFSRLTADFMR